MTNCKLCGGNVEQILNTISNRLTSEFKCESCGATYVHTAFNAIEDYPATIKFWSDRRRK